MAVNRYTCVYLFMVHILAPSHVLCFCVESFMLLYSVVLFLAFPIQCMGSEIIFWCFGDVLWGGLLLNSPRSLLFLVFSISWTALDIICLIKSESASPFILFVFVGYYRWPPLLPMNFLYVVALVVACVPFLPIWFWCTRPLVPWYIMRRALPLLLIP